MKKFSWLLGPFAVLLLVGAGCAGGEVLSEPEEAEEEMIEEEMEEEEMELMMGDGTYSVDVEASSVAWEGNKVGGSHNGTIAVSEGSLTVEDGAATGSVTIDMTSIVVLDIEDEASNQSLVDHLESEDFFSSEDFPTATFTITSIEATDDEGLHMVMGTFTMKDLENEVEFEAMIKEADGGYRLVAEFEIDRTLWDVRFGSSLIDEAKDVVVDDMIPLELDIMLSAE